MKLKDIILTTAPEFIKDSLVYEFNKRMQEDTLTVPVIKAYVDGLLHQIRCSEETSSEHFCLYVPRLKKGVIHDSLVFFEWDTVNEYEPIPAWDHLIPACFETDQVVWEDPSGRNILQLTESKAQEYLAYDTLPPHVDWTAGDLSEILNTHVLNTDAFSEPLIAVQVIQQFMEALGFGVTGNKDDDDFEDCFWDEEEESETSFVDELWSKTAIYHILNAVTGGIYE